MGQEGRALLEGGGKSEAPSREELDERKGNGMHKLGEEQVEPSCILLWI